MKILVFGDIYGRKGRELLARYLPELRTQYVPDFIVANTENLTNGKGPTPTHLEELRGIGFDAFTGGNHSFTHFEEIGKYMDQSESPQIRPANFYSTAQYTHPGRGYRIFEKNGKKILLINLISGVYLRDQVYNPFIKIEEILSEVDHQGVDAILVDFHRETTAESYCMAELLSGRASLVYGTHTHVQTNDDRILTTGTGAITDIGMTGSLSSSIGLSFLSILPGMVSGTKHFNAKSEADMGQ